MTPTNGNNIDIAFLTDLHFGHPKIPIEVMYDNFMQIILPRLKDVNLAIFGGDLFDRQISFDTPIGRLIMQLLKELLQYCYEYNILIRVLDGTFSHDRNQWRMLFSCPEYFGHKIHDQDFIRCFDVMDIEVIKPWNLGILYVPAEVNLDILDRGTELLKSAGLDKVDILVHHGYLAHLVPTEIVSKNHRVYSVDEFNTLTRGMILNGHVHTPSLYQNALSGGSFERLKHGEEESKGWHLLNMKLLPERVATKIEFIPNTRTLPFVTFDTSQYKHDVTECRRKLLELLNGLDKTLPKWFIRIIAENQSLRTALVAVVANYDHDIGYTSQLSKQQQLQQKVIVDLSSELDIFSPDELVNTIFKELGGKWDHAIITRHLRYDDC